MLHSQASTLGELFFEAKQQALAVERVLDMGQASETLRRISRRRAARIHPEAQELGSLEVSGDPGVVASHGWPTFTLPGTSRPGIHVLGRPANACDRDAHAEFRRSFGSGDGFPSSAPRRRTCGVSELEHRSAFRW